MIQKDINNWHLGLSNNIYKCRKCNKYNTIYIFTNIYQNCLFCGNPNYIK
jgi:hypothetical protein